MEFLLPILTAALITAFSVPVVVYLAKKYGLVDDPINDPHPKKVHKKIIPRAGGLAIYIGILTSSLLFIPVQKYLIGIFLGITLLLIIGLIDDKIRRFSPYTRLFLLFAAAGCAVASGIGIGFVTNPFNPSTVIFLNQIIIPFEFLGPHQIILIADIFAFLWIISLTQIINWSKGVDGQMPGITLVSSVVLAILSLKFYYQGDLSQLQTAKLAFIVAGVSLGFLVFNWHPSKILPGFSGSTILAFMLAVLSILSGAKVATAILVLAIPTSDFVYTIIRRLLAGKSPVWGDRGHLHHRLLDLGWSHQKIALFYMGLSAMLGAVALGLGSNSKSFVVLITIAATFLFILWINSFGGLSKPQDPDNG